MSRSFVPHRRRFLADILNPSDEPGTQHGTQASAAPSLNHGRLSRIADLPQTGEATGLSPDRWAGPSQTYCPSVATDSTSNGYSVLQPVSAAQRSPPSLSPTHPERPTVERGSSQAAQKRGAAAIQDAEQRPGAKRSSTGRGARPTGANQRSKRREQSTQEMTLNGIRVPMRRRGDDVRYNPPAPCTAAPRAFPANTTHLAELQVFRCMYREYKTTQDVFPCCLACTSHLIGATCRFQRIRTFLLDEHRRITGFYFANADADGGRDGPPVAFQPKWNVPFTPDLARETKQVIARALASPLRQELDLIMAPDVVYLPQSQATCDTCLASLVCAAWMCHLCGQVLCADCIAVLEGQAAAPAAPRADFAAYHWWFFSCPKRGAEHAAGDFVRVARLARRAVAAAVAEMEALVREDDTPPRSAACPEGLSQTVAAAELTGDAFRALWARGEAFLVTGVGRRLKLDWCEYLAQECDAQKCTVLNWPGWFKPGGQTMTAMALGELVGGLGRYEGRERCWKTQNWGAPVALLADLAQALPMPDHLRGNGVRNLTSHLPSPADGSKLEPVVTITYAHPDATALTMGEGRLHLARADTFVLLAHATPDPAGAPGGAVWDVFRAEDSTALRAFLRARFPMQNPARDPLRQNLVYLPAGARAALRREHGIAGVRVYQRAGDAMVVPAGCAFQVCNLSDCIAATVDFVSLENVPRCAVLEREFAEPNRRFWPHQPVLPLRAMLWDAWVSCCRQDTAAVV
ncbi:hypothetical protein B0H15DRAFT_990933 [Mycena belliarum]|uniref:JmjC domain-containing protein n=1 Tax=Mycena belliarum TaxID=1033014 RepID=A0AAD6UG30_9AGAR|nr:hypothetical protein B0H15DRAFT_990933 [Mycena belliae]